MSYEQVKIYKYICTECKRERESKFENIAKKAKCRKCRYPKVHKDQIPMFI